LALVLLAVLVIFASYHIEAVPVPNGVMYEGQFF
jgi:hypothetical protein